MISQMFTLQATFNAEVGSDVSVSPQQWSEAAAVEAGELSDYLGYKWWKSVTIDHAGASMELVDIVHFAISHSQALFRDNVLKEYGVSTIDDIIDLVTSILSTEPAFVIDEPVNYNSAEMRVRSINMITDEGDMLGVWKAVRVYMKALELEWSKIYQMYIGKNALNALRQDFGYNLGNHYLKVDLNNVEDNVVLETLQFTSYDDALSQLRNWYTSYRLLTSFQLLPNGTTADQLHKYFREAVLEDVTYLYVNHYQQHPIPLDSIHPKATNVSGADPKSASTTDAYGKVYEHPTVFGLDDVDGSIIVTLVNGFEFTIDGNTVDHYNVAYAKVEELAVFEQTAIKFHEKSTRTGMVGCMSAR